MATIVTQKEAHKHIEIFCCYARKDQELFQELKNHLMPLKREGLITLWADTDINAGTEWEKEIHLHLNTSHIILLLVSPDFMASDYCYSTEMTQAMKRHQNGEAQVIPIILRPVDWQDAPFAKLQALPQDAHPIISSKWSYPDEGFANVTKGIRKAIEPRLSQGGRQHLNKDIQQVRSVIDISGKWEKEGGGWSDDGHFYSPEIILYLSQAGTKITGSGILSESSNHPEDLIIDGTIDGVNVKLMATAVVRGYFECYEFKLTLIPHSGNMKGEMTPYYRKKGMFNKDKLVAGHYMAGTIVFIRANE